MIMDEMMKRMAREPALSGLTETDLLALLTVMEEVTLPAQKVLTWEETPVQEFGLVLGGSMGIYWGVDRLGALGPGDAFGVDELNRDKCWRHTLVTDSEVRVLVTSSAGYAPLVETNSRFAALFGRPEAVVTSSPRRFRFRSRRRALALG